MTLSRLLKITTLATMLSGLAGILAGSPEKLLAGGNAAGQQAGQASGSINNEDCAVCHEDLAKAFANSRHGILEKSPRFMMKNSCESCHGPGEAHALGDGDKTKIISFKESDKTAYQRQCLECHQSNAEILGFTASRHSKGGLFCADCHGVHNPAPMTRLLKSAPAQLCMSCHIERRADFAKPFHHRVNEGAMVCVDCHQPHGGFERRQLRTTHSGEEICVKCHLDKGGPFVFEHASLRLRDCQACHEPHGSNNTKMLVRSTVRSLCLECHSGTLNTFSAQPPAFHDIRSPRYQNCTSCHARIHGSNSSHLFLR